MSDTPVYVVANFIVHDADAYREYEKGFFPILKRHEGSFFTYDDNTVTFEGASPREGRMVMFSFPVLLTAVGGWLFSKLDILIKAFKYDFNMKISLQNLIIFKTT